MSEQKTRAVIIGAGPAGLTAAYLLTMAGVPVVVLEASAHVGGMAATIELWGQRVDIGPHRFFSSDARINRLWLEVVGRDYRMVDRLTRIYYGGKFYDYPLRPANALRNMGLVRAAQCMVSYLREKLSHLMRAPSMQTFEEWVVARFGRRLFEMFFKSYSEKLWGISCMELDADFAAQRIKKFSLGQAVLTALGLSRTKHKTLVDQFAYPLKGTGDVYERMAAFIRQNGGEIRLSTPVGGLVREGMRVTGVRLANDEVLPAVQVISTMPLTHLVKSLGDLPASVEKAVGSLGFRNTIIVYLEVDAARLFPDQWLYIHAPELEFGRLTNFRNWVPELYGEATSSILALEFWCYEKDAMWQRVDEALIELATQELGATGLIGNAVVKRGKVVRIPRCYPVYRSGYQSALAEVVEHLRQFEGITAIGRYGAFKYNNQDHSMLMGMMAAENITHNAGHDLWSVNTDYSSYQEEALITASGLSCSAADAS